MLIEVVQPNWVAEEPDSFPITTSGIFGKGLDSLGLEFRLPGKKLDRLKSLVAEFQGKSKATKKDLQVLAGHLAQASTVVRGGRAFLRELINLVKYLQDSSRAIK